MKQQLKHLDLPVLKILFGARELGWQRRLCFEGLSKQQAHWPSPSRPTPTPDSHSAMTWSTPSFFCSPIPNSSFTNPSSAWVDLGCVLATHVYKLEKLRATLPRSTSTSAQTGWYQKPPSSPPVLQNQLRPATDVMLSFYK